MYARGGGALEVYRWRETKDENEESGKRRGADRRPVPAAHSGLSISTSSWLVPLKNRRGPLFHVSLSLPLVGEYYIAYSSVRARREGFSVTSRGSSGLSRRDENNTKKGEGENGKRMRHKRGTVRRESPKDPCLIIWKRATPSLRSKDP